MNHENITWQYKDNKWVVIINNKEMTQEEFWDKYGKDIKKNTDETR